jgi:hypothetical protein
MGFSTMRDRGDDKKWRQVARSVEDRDDIVIDTPKYRI